MHISNAEELDENDKIVKNSACELQSPHSRTKGIVTRLARRPHSHGANPHAHSSWSRYSLAWLHRRTRQGSARAGTVQRASCGVWR